MVEVMGDPKNLKGKRKVSKKENQYPKNKKIKKTDEKIVNESKGCKVEEDWRPSYKLTPIPTSSSNDIANDGNAKSKGKKDNKSLGKWFPKAVVIKRKHHNLSSSSEGKERRSSLLLFYQYATPVFSSSQLSNLFQYLCVIGRTRALGGRIRIAAEGLNVTLSSVDCVDGDEGGGLQSASMAVRHFAEDLRRFDHGVFDQCDFKFIDCLPCDRHFKELKILPVKELVFYGIKDVDAPLKKGGVHLDAKEYHKMLKRSDAVVIDVRNHYEAAIGRFDGQAKEEGKKAKNKETSRVSQVSNGGRKTSAEEEEKRGAEYIDPQMRKSTDFPTWLEKSETKDKLKGKTVLMYCTGGVRCERASAYLKTKMGDDVGDVYQLQGGIERYLKAFPDGGFWRGKNFVFDKRESVGVGDVGGDGGVIRKEDIKKLKKTSQDNQVASHCCVCSSPWDRYVGKKKCYTCGVPVLMCDKCMSKKPDKTPGKELSVRCPLCVKENVTVPADSVEYTENGVCGRIATNTRDQPHSSSGGASISMKSTQGKAASSVLKWGGGHAIQKKEKRKMKRRICRFGTHCVRKDCFFSHPEQQT